MMGKEKNKDMREGDKQNKTEQNNTKIINKQVCLIDWRRNIRES